MKRYQAIILIALLTGWSQGISATEMPDGYPEEGFSWVGFIDAFDLEEGTLVVGDLAYRMDGQLVVRSRQRSFTSVSELKVGEKVGIPRSASTSESRTINEIWLLPNDYVEPNEP